MAEDGRISLVALQRLRRQRQDAAQLAFGRLDARASAIRAGIRRLELAMLEQTADLRRRLLDVGDAGRTGLHLIDIENVRAAISQEKACLDGLAQQLQQARQALLAAMKQRQVVDRLQERRDRELALTASRAQANELDDLHAAHRAGGPGET